MNHEEILDAIAQFGPDEIAKRWLMNNKKVGGACIASTAIGLIVLKHFGIEAEAVPVKMIVGNDAFSKLIDDGLPKMSQEELLATGAHYLLIDTRKKDNRFAGHLVIGIRKMRKLLDLSMRQFQRPNKGIHAPDAGVFETSERFWDDADNLEHRYYSPGCCVLIMRHLDAEGWTKAPDWWKHTHAHHEVAKKIIRKVERLATKR